MRYEILGKVRVEHAGECRYVNAPKVELLLRVLLIEADKYLTSSQLINEIWGEQVPRRAKAGLHVYISQIRKFLEQQPRETESPLRTQNAPPGYCLRLHDGEVDYRVWNGHLRSAWGAFAARDHQRASQYCARALALWRELPEAPASHGPIWVRNLRERVRFADTVEALLADGHRTFIEASPHPVLTLGLEECFEAFGVEAVTVPTLRRDAGGQEQVALAAGQAFAAGAPVDWPGWFPDGPRQAVDLPTYAFQRQRYWLAPQTGTGALSAAGLRGSGHPLLPGAVHLPDGALVLTGRIPAGVHGWLGEHAVAGTAMVPGTVLVEWALHAAHQAGCGGIEELMLRQPIARPTVGDLQIRVFAGAPAQDGTREVRVDSRTEQDGFDDRWTCHASGLLAPHASAQQATGPDTAGLGTEGAWPPPGAEPLEVAEFYAQAEAAGYLYGEAYHGLRALWRHGDELLAEVVLPEGAGDEEDGFGIHPVLLDAALHPALGAVGTPPAHGRLWMPFAWSGVSLWADGARTVRVRLTPRHSEDESGDQRELRVAVADARGAPVLNADSVVLRPADAARIRAAAQGSGRLFTLAWTPLPLADAPTVAHTRAGWVTLADQGPRAVAEAMDGGAVVAVADVHTGSGSGLVEVERASALVRTWLAEPRPPGARLVLLTRGAWSVGLSHGPAAPHPAETGIRGRLRQMLSAHQGRVVLLDVEPAADVGRAGAGGQAPDPAPVPLDAEPAAAVQAALDSGEQVVALRAGRLLAPRWIPDTAPAAAHEPAADSGGTVLVSGGTGSWGARVAEHLARTGRAAHLVLVSRRGPAAPAAAELAARLRAYGPRVSVVAADLTDPQAVAGVLAGIDPAHPLTGIVHAAGARAGAPAQVWHAKATVAAQLAAATQELPLRWFVVFTAPVTDPDEPNAIDHAAAHTYCDALIAHRHARGLPGTAVTWSPGADPAQDGAALLDAVWSHRQPHLLAAGPAGPLPAAPPHSAAVRAQAAGRRRAAAGQADQPADWAGRLTGLSPDDRRRTVLELVLGHAAAVLGHTDPAAVPAQAAFKKLGFSSLTDDIDVVEQAPPFDLCVNIHSFTEMTPATVRECLDLIAEKCRAFYVKNPVGKFLDKALDGHFKGNEAVQMALQTGPLRKVIDIFDSEAVAKVVPDYIDAYTPGEGWHCVAEARAIPWSYFRQDLYKDGSGR